MPEAECRIINALSGKKKKFLKAGCIPLKKTGIQALEKAES